jgi:alkyl hydroperoxide reductase subunit F
MRRSPVHGKKTVVAGVGIPGITASLYLDEIAESVVLVTPTKELKAKETIYLDKIAQSSVSVITNAAVRELRGERFLTTVVIEDKETGAVTELPADGIFVNIGKVPNTGFLQDSPVQLDKKGFIVIDDTQMTSVPNVFAVGDATTHPYKQISTAVGDGARAALTVARLIK